MQYANTFANMPCENIMKGYERLPPMMKGYERCSKMLRIWRKNSLKRVLSFSREYWVYFDITSKRSSEFEF